MNSSAIVGLNAFLNSQLSLKGLDGLLWNFFADRFTYTMLSVTTGKYTYNTNRTFQSLWRHCAVLVNKTMYICANTLSVNDFTSFKIYL